MKQLLLAILGVLSAWLVLNFFTHSWETKELFYLIIGIVLGFSIRKPPVTDTE